MLTFKEQNQRAKEIKKETQWTPFFEKFIWPAGDGLKNQMILKLKDSYISIYISVIPTSLQLHNKVGYERRRKILYRIWKNKYKKSEEQEKRIKPSANLCYRPKICDSCRIHLKFISVWNSQNLHTSCRVSILQRQSGANESEQIK